MTGWKDVVDHALGLPEVELASHYGSMVPKLRGRALCAPGRHPEESFVLMLPSDTAAMLVDVEPEHFYQTPHYVGWPSVLVRWDTPWETIVFWLGQAWRYRAPRRLLKSLSEPG